MITLIAAMTEKNRVIGKDNKLPWHLPADLQHFKQLTYGKSILMGRATWESIGRALPGRKNIILSSQIHLKAEGCEVFHSKQSALASLNNKDELIIIGGENIYRQFLTDADRMELTFVDVDLQGDRQFPNWDPKQWQETSREKYTADSKNPYDYSFVTFIRRQPS